MRNCLSIEERNAVQLSNEHLVSRAHRLAPGFVATAAPTSTTFGNKKRSLMVPSPDGMGANQDTKSMNNTMNRDRSSYRKKTPNLKLYNFNSNMFADRNLKEQLLSRGRMRGSALKQP